MSGVICIFFNYCIFVGCLSLSPSGAVVHCSLKFVFHLSKFYIILIIAEFLVAVFFQHPYRPNHYFLGTRSPCYMNGAKGFFVEVSSGTFIYFFFFVFDAAL